RRRSAWWIGPGKRLGLFRSASTAAAVRVECWTETSEDSLRSTRHDCYSFRSLAGGHFHTLPLPRAPLPLSLFSAHLLSPSESPPCASSRPSSPCLHSRPRPAPTSSSTRSSPTTWSCSRA